MKKSFISFFLTLSFICLQAPVLAGPKDNALIKVRGDKLPFNNLLENEKAREIRNAKKVITDRDLQILGSVLLTKRDIWHLPEDYEKITIKGKAVATRQQAVAFLKWYCPVLPLDTTPEELVTDYYLEASKEGMKWDMVFCQALLETGFFNFGGTVVPEQNNFCGLGTTSATVRGSYFLTPLLGVRAHVQHLMAYTTMEKPRNEIIDPRYKLVHNLKSKTGFATTWRELNGKWATGSDYAEKIIALHEEMKSIIAVNGNLLEHSRLR